MHNNEGRFPFFLLWRYRPNRA